MDAGGDEQDVQPLGVGALDVGGHPVADAEHPRARDRTAGQALGLRDAQLIDGRMGLAGHDHLAAEGLVELGERAAAVDQPVAPLDHDVGIGADHLQPAGRGAFEPVLIVARAFGLIIDGSGAGDEGGLVEALEGQAEPLIERRVPVGAQAPGGAGRPLGQQQAGGVAGGDKGRPGLPRDAEGVELGDHVGRGPRRVGDQDHRPPLGPPARERRTGGRKALAAIVDDAPDVAQQDVIVVDKVGKALGRLRRAHGLRR